MDTPLFSFEKLTAYQAAKFLVKQVYSLTGRFPQTEQFSLTIQLRRSITSVPSNIAEGSGRNSLKEKIHFLEIAYGSLMEAYCQLDLAAELGYISEKDLQDVKPTFFSISRMLSALSNSFKKKLNQLSASGQSPK